MLRFRRRLNDETAKINAEKTAMQTMIEYVGRGVNRWVNNS